jgi:molybdopterin synthase catalytic subunit
VLPPTDAEDWTALSASALDMDAALAWVALPSCGATVAFVGSVRDHSDGRPGVSALEYEAYEEHALGRLGTLAAEARRRWPGIGRTVLWHRTGALALTDTTVVVAVSTPHRDEAFEAARWCIDTLKSTVPIWKHEMWAGGEDWGLDAVPVTEVGSL